MKIGDAVKVIKNSVGARANNSRNLICPGETVVIILITPDRVYYKVTNEISNYLLIEDVILAEKCTCKFISFLKNGCTCDSWLSKKLKEVNVGQNKIRYPWWNI